MKIFVSFVLLATTIAASSIMNCDSEGPGYFKFSSRTVAIGKISQPVEFEGRCFKNIQVTVSETENAFDAKITATGHKGKFCIEFLIVSSGKSSDYKFMFLDGKFDLSISKRLMSEGELSHVRTKGLHVLRSCDDFKNLPQNLIMSLKMFLGGFGKTPYIPIFGSKIPDYQLKANIDFAEKYTGYKWEMRTDPKLIALDKKHIRSGDYFAIIRFDGVDNLIHMGTGSRSGHNSMALWHEGELYMVESQDGWYWPRRGIQKNLYEDWVRYANNCDMNVVHMKLRDDLSQSFDAKKAWTAFSALEGHPYGYSNFLFVWLDTVENNLPDIFDMVFLSIVLNVLEKFIPEQINLIFYEGWNKRLGTFGLSMGGIWEELYKRELSLGELSAVVEKEGWEYPTGRNFVCSSFIIYMYKMGGLFGDLEINATEFTPKDLYDLNFFDVSGQNLAPECRGYAPHGYCQLMGRVHLDLGKVSWVEPYSHMNENCPSKAPFFERPENC